MNAEMQFKRNLKKIHMLGKGPTWVNCPGRDEEYNVEGEEIWSLGSVFDHHKSVDRIFLMHDPRQELVYEDRDYFKKVREYDKPIYSQEKYDVLGPKNEAYPVDYVLSHFPVVYYTNAVCWMLALAILLEPEEIVFHGIDMQVAMEYHNERGGTEFWTGIAMGKGIKVTIPDGSAICTTNSVWGPMYGFIPITSSGLLMDWATDFRGFDRPKILEEYRLVPIADAYQGPLKDWDKVCTCTGGLVHANCPLCGANNPTTVSLHGLPVEHGKRCGKCGLYYRNMRIKDYKKFYSSGEFDKKLRDVDDGYFIGSANLRVAKLGKWLDVDSILDIGCGEGHFLETVDIPVTDGIDPTTERYITGFFPEDMPASKFDLITMFHVIEHQPDPVEFLRSTLDFLNDDGHIVVEYPCVDRRLLRVDEPLGRIFDNESHFCEFDEKTINILFSKCGYEVVDRIYMGDEQPLDKNVMVIGKKL